MVDEDDTVKSAISLDLGDDGVAAANPPQVEFPRRVAPALAEDLKHNTVKPFLIVVGCTSLPHVQFDFDSSFLLAQAKVSFQRLAKMRDDLSEPGVPSPTAPEPPRKLPPLGIFGHADPVGRKEYNSPLSARRAIVVYAVLIRDTSIWEGFFTNKMQPEVWGKRQQELMEAEVGPRASRRELIEAYMDALCVRDSGGRLVPFKLSQADDFLGGDADTKGHRVNVQGCGEFNPTFILSTENEKELDKKDPTHEQRNAANRINRRVIAFLFKPGSKINPDHWPCPGFKTPDPGSICRKRFWSDEIKSAKRTTPDKKENREFKKTEDTFGCRFYQGIAFNSPCEGIHKQWAVRVLLETPRFDKPPRPRRNRHFVATVGDAPGAPLIRGKTDSEGILRLPVLDEQVTMKLRLDAAALLVPEGDLGRRDQPTPDEEETFPEFELGAGELRFVGDGSLPDKPDSGTPETERHAAKQRLFNLGYGPGKLVDWTEDDLTLALRRFQEREQLADKSGALTEETKKRLVEEHEPRAIRAGETEPASPPPAKTNG
jgi:outer membrane protein OmpA-like peptidoglycan-associated protein